MHSLENITLNSAQFNKLAAALRYLRRGLFTSLRLWWWSSCWCSFGCDEILNDLTSAAGLFLWFTSHPLQGSSRYKRKMCTVSTFPLKTAAHWSYERAALLFKSTGLLTTINNGRNTCGQICRVGVWLFLLPTVKDHKSKAVDAAVSLDYNCMSSETGKMKQACYYYYQRRKHFVVNLIKIS